MKQKFIEENYKIVDFEDIADIYVVNTCTVTNISDRKSRQIIRRVKEKNKKSILVVTGCYAQVAKDELEKIEEIDIIIGNQEKRNIVSYIQTYQKEREESISNILYEKEFAEFGTTTYTDKTRAVIKIQDGCDRFCSYCIIPYARGRIRSRNPDEIIKEVKEVAKKGIKEVVITGIHLASYGKDVKNMFPLLEVVKKINEIPEIRRIRLGSLEPTLMEEDFILELAKLEKVCNHFHLSLQSGCNSTLERMNRRYTVEEFEKGIEIIRQNYKDVSLTTDIIVGFPGENENEFKSTYDFLEKITFYKMHVFKYSQRKGTKAAIMPVQIDSEIKEKRSKILIELSDKKQKEQNRKYIGKELEVLFEEQDGKYIKGHTSNYIMVYVETDDIDIENKVKKVKITGVLGEDLLGEMI